MFNNKLIDWEVDNGVYLPMILDVERNKFYDKILKNNVQNKTCVDVGFGTGLLSLLALKYGARHITAYEFTYERYRLGKHIIKTLGLEDKITLLNERFTNETYKNFHDSDTVVFHEVIDYNIWKEGVAALYNGPLTLLPNTVGCNFYYVPLEAHEFNNFSRRAQKEQEWFEFYDNIKMDGWPDIDSVTKIHKLPPHIRWDISLRCNSIKNKVVKPNLTTDLNFGIDLPENYTNLIELLSTEFFADIMQDPIESVTAGVSLEQYREFIDRGVLIGNYKISHNTGFTCPTFFDTNVVVPGQQGMILPEYYLQHNEHVLTVSPSNKNPMSHWQQPGRSEITLISGPVTNLLLRTYTDSGDVRAYESK